MRSAVRGITEVDKKEEEKELCGGDNAPHEETDGYAGVVAPHDHGAADAQSHYQQT